MILLDDDTDFHDIFNNIISSGKADGKISDLITVIKHEVCRGIREIVSGVLRINLSGAGMLVPINNTCGTCVVYAMSHIAANVYSATK